MNGDALSPLSGEELIEVILAQGRQIAGLQQRIAELEERLGGPPKSSRTSSLPPSRNRKANKPPGPEGQRRQASVGRRGGGRRLHEDPDERIEARLKRCPHCAATPEDADASFCTGNCVCAWAAGCATAQNTRMAGKPTRWRASPPKIGGRPPCSAVVNCPVILAPKNRPSHLRQIQ